MSCKGPCCSQSVWTLLARKWLSAPALANHHPFLVWAWLPNVGTPSKCGSLVLGRFGWHMCDGNGAVYVHIPVSVQIKALLSYLCPCLTTSRVRSQAVQQSRAVPSGVAAGWECAQHAQIHISVLLTEEASTHEMLYGNWQFSLPKTLSSPPYQFNLLSKHFRLPCKIKLWKYLISSQSQQPLFFWLAVRKPGLSKWKNGNVPANSAFLHPRRKQVDLLLSSLKEFSPKLMPSCRKMFHHLWKLSNLCMILGMGFCGALYKAISFEILKYWLLVKKNRRAHLGWEVGLEG